MLRAMLAVWLLGVVVGVTAGLSGEVVLLGERVTEASALVYRADVALDAAYREGVDRALSVSQVGAYMRFADMTKACAVDERGNSMCCWEVGW